jgi:hypothetical protein
VNYTKVQKVSEKSEQRRIPQGSSLRLKNDRFSGVYPMRTRVEFFPCYSFKKRQFDVFFVHCDLLGTHRRKL